MKRWLVVALGAVYAASAALFACSSGDTVLFVPYVPDGGDVDATSSDAAPDHVLGQMVDAGQEAASDEDAAADAGSDAAPACIFDAGVVVEAGASCCFGLFDTARPACGTLIRVGCSGVGQDPPGVPGLSQCEEWVDSGFGGRTFLCKDNVPTCFRRPVGDSYCATNGLGTMAWECPPSADGGLGALPGDSKCVEAQQLNCGTGYGYCCP